LAAIGEFVKTPVRVFLPLASPWQQDPAKAIGSMRLIPVKQIGVTGRHAPFSNG
jgi:hypothetical protein